jgi:hypothetical protein
MKIFVKYTPTRIARYVKTFFKGRLYIKGRGAYAFENGRLATLSHFQSKRHQQTVVDINEHIDSFDNNRVA